MRCPIFLFALLLGASALPAQAQQVVQEFSGSGETTTGFFTTTERWEVRWNARQAVSVAVLAPDGSLVAGGSGVLRGSLFVPAGGKYYLKITDGTAPPPPPVPAHAPAPTPATNAPATTGTNSPPVAPTNAAPVITPDTPPSPEFLIVPEPAPQQEISWHVQVVQLPAAVASTDSLTVYTPYFLMPDSAVVTVAPPPPPPPPAFTPEQLRGIVTLKGDAAQGTGALVRFPNGVAVAAHLSLVAGNTNLQIFSASGTPLKVLSAKAAVDRDLVLITVQDDHLAPLPLPAKDAAPTGPGDDVLAPLIGGNDPTAARRVKIVSMAPDRIDFDAPLPASSAGAPILGNSTGTVLGIVATEKRIDLSEKVAMAWAKNPAPESFDVLPSFGLPLQDVAAWEPIDLTAFLQETTVLHDFHDTTRCLDSFLNGRRRYGNRGHGGDAPDSQYYTNNGKLSTAEATYKKFATGGDHEQVLDSARELLFDLQSIADGDMDQLQTYRFSCSYSRRRAQEEVAYRKAIKAELDTYADQIARFNAIAQAR
jgi:hypothetical protein